LGEIQNVKEQKAKLGRDKKCSLIRIKKIAVNGKVSLLTPCCCGWGDGSMIFNPNALEVAPPQSSGVSALGKA
jgi:hypothetical protein